MKERTSRVFLLSAGYNFLLIVVLIILLIYDFGPTITGSIGDTFGGILSPVIGAFSIYFIYKTFEAQREQLEDQKVINNTQRKQLEDQREQYHVSRITDIIYLQLERINESIKSQSFLLSDESQHKAQGYTGIYSFNELVVREQLNGMYLLNDSYTELYRLIVKNLNQLIDIYENTSTSVVIINNLLTDSNLSTSQINDLRSLLVLNLGNSMRNNINYISKYLDFYTENSTELDSIWDTENQIAQLRQQVTLVRTFFENVSLPTSTIQAT